MNSDADNTCEGSASQDEDCVLGNCPFFNNWSSWSDCSVSCGGGQQSTSRSCVNGNIGDVGCIGDGVLSRTCNRGGCPQWTTWGNWTDCTASCDGGLRSRSRSCTLGSPGDFGCDGPITMQDYCNPDACPMWSVWNMWSSCSATCGGGNRQRSRNCLNGVEGEAGCEGEADASEVCNLQECPFWDVWTQWSSCSHDCGGGFQSHTRVCVNGRPGNTGCDGSESQERPCNLPACPEWNAWTPWSECSASCGQGTTSRSRTCTIPGACSGPTSEEKACQESICATWTYWSAYDACSASCGGGAQTRRRTCTNGEPGDAGCVGSATESTNCNMRACPAWSEWTTWTTCTKTCGRGQQKQERTCMNGIQGMAGCRGPKMIYRPCNIQTCPTYGDWSLWSPCTVSCGLGQVTRTRTCSDAAGGCIGLANEERECIVGNCPYWSHWGAWGACSASCGTGTYSRSRACVNGDAGDSGCEGSITEESNCNEQVCPVLSDWVAWSACSVTCGPGVRSRGRSCFNADGSQCPGAGVIEEPCNNGPCPYWSSWGEFGPCSSSCGGGRRIHFRTCVNGQAGEDGCEGSTSEILDCNSHVNNRLSSLF
ncbi:semaphorin-5B-like [Ciona intestinalis]